MKSKAGNIRRRRIVAVTGLLALGLVALLLIWGLDSSVAGRAGRTTEERAAVQATPSTPTTPPATAAAGSVDARGSTATTVAPEPLRSTDADSSKGITTTTKPSAASSSEPTTSPAHKTAAGAGTVKVQLYFVKGEALAPVTREIPRTEALGAATLKLLLAGPTVTEKANGFGSTIPQGTAAKGLSIKDGLATADLSGTFASGGGTLSMYTRLGQLVYTLTQFPTVDSLRLRLDGKDVTTLGGEGLMIGSSLTRSGYERLIGTPTTAVAPKYSTFKVYFVQGERLVATQRQVPATQAIGAAAVTNLLKGPAGAEVAQGMASAIPAGVRLNGLSIKGGVATVDLSKSFASGGGSLSMYLRLGQLVYTLTEFPTVGKVQLKLDGQAVTSLGGEGLLIGGPLSRTDWVALMK